MYYVLDVVGQFFDFYSASAWLAMQSAVVAMIDSVCLSVCQRMVKLLLCHN